jgi:hypothetical protein
MTTSVADDDRPALGVTIPMWALAIIGTVLTAGAAWVSSSFFSLRDDNIRMEQRVDVVERDLRRVDSVPASMATMSADIGTIKEQLTELRADVKRLANGTKR